MFVCIWPYSGRIELAKEMRHRLRHFRYIIRHGCMLDARMLRTAVDEAWWG